MEVDNLKGFVLTIVLVGMLIGAGVLALDKFSTATFDPATEVNESIVWGYNKSIQLSNTNLISFNNIQNHTGGVMTGNNYSVVLQTGVINVLNVSPANNTLIEGELANATYTYKVFNAPTQTALNAVRNSVSDIATIWLGLIITIAILSILIVLITRSFGQR